ncbi:VOC family protein [Mycobacterium pinniadriaticum]|uniref:VOC family protein n=1 Tax=Mycobacterium pinniadriaticum TaxID=2994102 RepID=UPI0038992B58
MPTSWGWPTRNSIWAGWLATPTPAPGRTFNSSRGMRPRPRTRSSRSTPTTSRRLTREARASGFEIVHPLSTEDWGVRRFFVRAPDGNIINVVAHHD